ncbi:DUF7709 family protein [Deminuibacter soli]|uniref:DUF7709 domain-containing protein n=1 Tax=Deminuibacter soli TaxID=2291815 RepID=A0A3E1NIV3_9BACT|nr:hypothetical protein [Deminuibacter soli]RFM27860.1 hypothetical protein DXN05_14295 [Deminuibacter soli]
MPNKQSPYISSSAISIQVNTPKKIQPNTLAAVLHNVELYNKGQRGKVEAELEAAIPHLFKAGAFTLFSPEEWMAGNNPGRALVGRLALEYVETNSWLGIGGCSAC